MIFCGHWSLCSCEAESAVVDANALSSATFLPPLLCSSAEALGEYGAVAFIRAEIKT